MDRPGEGVLHRHNTVIGLPLLYLAEHIGEALHKPGCAAGEQLSRRFVGIGSRAAAHTTRAVSGDSSSRSASVSWRRSSSPAARRRCWIAREVSMVTL